MTDIIKKVGIFSDKQIVRAMRAFLSTLSALLLISCAQKYPYDLSQALEFKNISDQNQSLVTVVGSTNGPFRYLGPPGMLSAGQPGRLGYVPERGAGVSWTAPAASTNAFICYSFMDPSGKVMLVVKTVSH